MKADEIKTELEDGKNLPTASHEVSQDEQDFIRLAIKRFKSYDDAYGDNIKEAIDDHEFIVNGKQWDEANEFVKKRNEKGLPCLTINHGLTYVDNTIGEINQNLPRVKYRGKDSGTDPKQADIRTSLLHHIEDNSDAPRAYYEALKQSVTAGYPAWLHIKNDYPDYDTFNQEIFIKHIPFQFSVKLDPSAVNQYASPAEGGPKWGSLEEVISRAEFVKRFPKAEAVSLENTTADEQGWWMSTDVRIASYYNAEPKKITLCLLEGGAVVEKDSDEYKQLEEAATLAGSQLVILKERETEKWEIFHYVISSREILKGPERVPGTCIPLVPVEGKYNWVNGKKTWRGVYTTSKDANKLENIFASKAVESVLVGPRYVATAKQIAGYSDLWQNPEGHRVLYFENDPDRPQGDKPTLDSGTGIEAKQSVDMMKYAGDIRKDLTGVQDPSLGKRSNETSGRAILARDAQAGQTNYEFPANLAMSQKYVAKIIDGMIPEVYDYEMVLRIIGDDQRQKPEPITINKVQTVADGQGNVIKTILNDMSAGKFDIMVDVGPSLKTQRMETADNMVKLAASSPKVMDLGGDILFDNLDIKGADILSERWKATLPPQIRDAGQEQDSPEARMQAQVEQAVKAVQAQSMQAFKAAEQKIMADQQALQQAAQAIDALKRQLADKGAELGLKSRELDIEEKKISADIEMERIKAQGGVKEAAISAVSKEMDHKTAMIAVMKPEAEPMKPGETPLS